MHVLQIQPSLPRLTTGWTTEFNAKNICLTSKNPARFVKCQWHYERDPCSCYLVYRWVLAAGFTTALVCNAVFRLQRPISFGSWMTRLSSWVWMTCGVQILMAAVMVTIYYVGKWRRSHRLVDASLCPYAVYWMLNNIATNLMILASYHFWSSDYPIEHSPRTKGIFVVKLLKFFVSPFLILVDFWIVSHTMKLFHVVYSLLFHFIYDIASYIFYFLGLSGSRYVSTWVHPKQRMLQLSLQNYGIIILIHIATFLMQKLRKALYFVLWKYCKYPLEDIGNRVVTDEELISPKLSSPQLGSDLY